MRSFAVVSCFGLALTGAAWSQTKSQSYNGTLLDSKCAASAGVSTPLTASGLSADEKAPSKDKTSTPGEEPMPVESPGEFTPCQATLTSLTFALRTRGGRVLNLDQKGNDKIVMLVESDQKWKDALNSVTSAPLGKAERAKTKPSARRVVVTGRIEKDVLQVDTVRLQ